MTDECVAVPVDLTTPLVGQSQVLWFNTNADVRRTLCSRGYADAIAEIIRAHGAKSVYIFPGHVGSLAAALRYRLPDIHIRVREPNAALRKICTLNLRVCAPLPQKPYEVKVEAGEWTSDIGEDIFILDMQWPAPGAFNIQPTYFEMKLPELACVHAVTVAPVSVATDMNWLLRNTPADYAVTVNCVDRHFLCTFKK